MGDSSDGSLLSTGLREFDFGNAVDGKCWYGDPQLAV